jgi:uncharacterized protein YegL
MKQTKTIYHLIVDKSGSMTDCLENTINGFNEQITRIRNLEMEYPNDKITIGLTTFNDAVTINFIASNPKDVQFLSSSTYQPDGSTALLDAIGLTVKMIENEVDRTKTLETTTVIIVVITDGYENASKVYSLNDIRMMVSKLEETKKWTFAFIGATFDAVEIASQMSFKSQNSYSFNKKEMESVVWEKLNHSLSSYCYKKVHNKLDSNLFDESN